MTDAAGTSVHMKNNCMIPTVLRVATGTNVTFTSADLEAHTVTGAGYRDDRGWGSMDELRQGDTVAFTFEESGVFPYFCLLHPGMIGTIVVGDGVPQWWAPRAACWADRVRVRREHRPPVRATATWPLLHWLDQQWHCCAWHSRRSGRSALPTPHHGTAFTDCELGGVTGRVPTPGLISPVEHSFQLRYGPVPTRRDRRRHLSRSLRERGVCQTPA